MSLEIDDLQIQVPKITLEDFDKVKDRHKPTVNKGDLKKLKMFNEEFGVEGEEKGKSKTVSK